RRSARTGRRAGHHAAPRRRRHHVRRRPAPRRHPRHDPRAVDRRPRVNAQEGTPMSRTSVTRRPVRRWPAVVVALAAPLALVVVLLAASWAPSDALGQVKAAVVNQDEPVTLEGQYTPLGRQLAGALVEGSEVDANYEWVVTDEADATAGL